MLQSKALDLLVIESGNDIVTHHPRFGCRRILDGRYHLEQAVLHRNLKTKAAELAACLNLHVAEALWIEIRRMWIERRQHAVDGVFNQLLIIGLFDIVRTHMLKHVAEKSNLTIQLRIAVRGRWAPRQAHHCGTGSDQAQHQ